ncbi:MAG: hypothetical protein HDS65_01610 [Bacteroidales bacterium]|nr:hypothetical protein [Bacteroidales bacterium]
MKSSFRYFLAAAVLTSSAYAYADNRDWGGINRYAKANAELPAPAKGEHRVVFMGNSITENWFGTHPEFFKSNNYIGRGISGHTSSQFLVRFREDVVNLKPEVVIINAGTNDCAENSGPFDVDITFGNIVSMTEIAQANGIKVILSSVLPAAEFGWNRNITDAADRIAALNAKIKAYADEHKLPYVDYYSAVVYGPERALNPEYTNDGVHPTAAGYDVLEAIVKPVIDKTIKKKK